MLFGGGGGGDLCLVDGVHGCTSFFFLFVFFSQREKETRGGASVSSVPSLSVCREFAVFVFGPNDVAFTSDPQD